MNDQQYKQLRDAICFACPRCLGLGVIRGWFRNKRCPRCNGTGNRQLPATTVREKQLGSGHNGGPIHVFYITSSEPFPSGYPWHEFPSDIPNIRDCYIVSKIEGKFLSEKTVEVTVSFQRSGKGASK